MERDEVGAEATATTRATNDSVLEALPFEDTSDFDNVGRGFVATRDDPLIRGAGGEVLWDLDAYAFLDGDRPDTANPSLWRHATLNSRHGLFEVTDGIYQVRAFDVANITFVEGDTGWIIIDPLTNSETAAAALELVEKELSPRPIHAVIYTHSHADHFGGVRGVISDDDVKSGKTKVIAPEGFLKHAVSENVIAGNAMSRRAVYHLGSGLPTDPRGHIDTGIGKTIPRGTTGLIAPTDVITETGTEMTIDGVDIVFQNTPETEAPAEMCFFFPQRNALCMAELCTEMMHNLYTLRGAQVRDGLGWSKYIGEAIELFGDSTDVAFASHSWPRWGRDAVRRYLGQQRDMYRYIHDQTMRLANDGHTMVEIAEMLDLPETLAGEFHARGYYGTVSHNAKAVYQRYLGWFDGNPANLNSLPPVEASVKYVELMGGADAVLDAAAESFEAGEYRWVAQLVNHVVFADPENASARELQAAALEQLGYQAESGIWRNFYLSGVQELRADAATKGMGLSRASAESFIPSVPLDMILDTLAVRLDGPSAAGMSLSINLDFTDTGEQYLLLLANSALSHIPDKHDPDADMTLHLPRSVLDAILIAGPEGIAEVLAGADFRVEGERSDALGLLFSLLRDPDPAFNIVTP